MSLEKIAKPGRLVDVFPLFVRSTIQHADEIQADRFAEIKSKGGDVSKTELPNQWFRTADLPMYMMEGREAILYMGRNKDNLVFDNIVEATRQITENENYSITNRQSIDSVINSDTTLRVVLSDLKLQGNDSEWRYFEIDTERYDKLNNSQRALAERVHGQGEAFKNSMEMLRKAGKKTTTVYVLNPEYVKKNVPENGAIARVSALNDFNGGSNFIANLGDVDINVRRLRGVLSTSEAGALKIVKSKTYDIGDVLGEASRISSFAPDQITMIRNIFRQGNYQIIKGESQ